MRRLRGDLVGDQRPPPALVAKEMLTLNVPRVPLPEVAVTVPWPVCPVASVSSTLKVASKVSAVPETTRGEPTLSPMQGDSMKIAGVSASKLARVTGLVKSMSLPSTVTIRASPLQNSTPVTVGNWVNV